MLKQDIIHSHCRSAAIAIALAILLPFAVPDSLLGSEAIVVAHETDATTPSVALYLPKNSDKNKIYASIANKKMKALTEKALDKYLSCFSEVDRDEAGQLYAAMNLADSEKYKILDSVAREVGVNCAIVTTPIQFPKGDILPQLDVVILGDAGVPTITLLPFSDDPASLMVLLASNKADERPRISIDEKAMQKMGIRMSELLWSEKKHAFTLSTSAFFRKENAYIFLRYGNIKYSNGEIDESSKVISFEKTFMTFTKSGEFLVFNAKAGKKVPDNSVAQLLSCAPFVEMMARE